jgi:large subunit ribosomal protein L35
VAKYKLKNHRGAKKRFKITGTGKIMRMKGPRSHLRRRKAPRVRALFDRMIQISPTDEKRVRRGLPYTE